MEETKIRKPLVEAIKTVRPGRKLRRIMAWSVFLALSTCLAAMTLIVILNMAGVELT